MSRKQARFGQPAVYNATPPTLIDGDDSALNVDVNGNILVSISGSGGGTTQIQGNVASLATDSGNPVKTGAVYNSTPVTVSNGQRVDSQADVNGNLNVNEATQLAMEDLPNALGAVQTKPVASATYAPTVYKDAGTVTKANIKVTPGNVYSIRFTNTNAAVRYFQLHNKATAPAAADTAQCYWVIPAGTTTVPAVLELEMTYFAPSEYFTTGIGWAVSTTATTFTDSATASDHLTHVRYM